MITENILRDENSSCEVDGGHEISLSESTDTNGKIIIDKRRSRRKGRVEDGEYK